MVETNRSKLTYLVTLNAILKHPNDLLTCLDTLHWDRLLFSAEPFVCPFALVLLLPESQMSERLCQLTDVSEDILCVSKDIVSLKAKFTTGLHKILHRGHKSPSDYFGAF